MILSDQDHSLILAMIHDVVNCTSTCAEAPTIESSLTLDLTAAFAERNERVLLGSNIYFVRAKSSQNSAATRYRNQNIELDEFNFGTNRKDLLY